MNTKRWLTKRSGWTALGTILIAAVAWMVTWQDDVSSPVEMAKLDTVLAQPQALAEAVSAQASQVARRAPAVAPAATIEYPAPWPALLHFETGQERSRRIDREDPFLTVDDLAAIMARAAKGDAAAALRLHNLAEYCGQHRPPPNPPPGHLQLDCSAPTSWTTEQRRAWRFQAVFSGDAAPAMSMLTEADRMAPTNPARAALVSDALLSLDYAARRGCLECVVQLASLHRDGDRVQQDLRQTFAYLQIAAAASGDPIFSEHAAKIRPSLRPIDLEFARALQERLVKAIQKNKAR